MNKILFFLFSLLLFIEVALALPTKDFISHYSIQPITQVLNQYGMNETDQNLFIRAIEAENDSFIGYHAGCSSYRLFQDIIRFVVEEKLEIPVRDEFHFLRIPGEEVLQYPSAAEFIAKFIPNYNGGNFSDDKPETRIYILSLNIALYQSFFESCELTPRYYLENRPWTSPAFWKYLEDFFVKVGLDEKEVLKIVNQMTLHFPQNRGFLMQFFDPTEDHSFLQTHFFAAHPFGNPIKPEMAPRSLILNPTINKQLRLVIDNRNILNPFGKMVIKRYDSMSDSEKKKYESILRKTIQNLPIDKVKSTAFRNHLIELWQ